jgi:hypothetical protein
VKSTAIPDWLPTGVLPPINPLSPTTTDRSPYTVTLTDLVLRFNTSPKRRTILTGFLKFREALHGLGVKSGFQWLDGSFLENIETTEARPPCDIDVVTFFYLPSGVTQMELFQRNEALFRPSQTKQNFNVDAYFVSLDTANPEPLVAQATYWYSMWSHRRSGEWKGYLQIDLGSAEDSTAEANLLSPNNSGGNP